MALRIGNREITEMSLNGHKVIEGRLNGNVLFKFEGTTYMSYQIDTSQAPELFPKQIAIPFRVGEYGSNLATITILWGDGNTTTINNGSITTENIVHTYENDGIYDIYIYSSNGKIPEFNFGTISNGIFINMRRLIKMYTPILPMIDTTGAPITNGMVKMFYYAVNLESVPEDLFIFNNQGEDFSYAFGACYKLETVPANIFEYCHNIKNVSHCFYLSTGFVTIPETLFENNSSIEDISFIFSGCTNLSYIPIELMEDLPNVKNARGAFQCKSLQFLTPGLLDTNTELTDVSFLFDGSGLNNVPDYFFKYNTKITTFESCFAECSNFRITSNIFCDENTEMGTRFAGQNVNFTNCFNRSEYTGYQGTAPQLWNYTYGSVTSTDCFSGDGNSGDSLTNYYIIPEEWGGPYEENSMTMLIDTSLGGGSDFVIPFDKGTFTGLGTITIEWGDNATTTISNNVINDTNRKHTYATDGEYAIKIRSSSGKIPIIDFVSSYSTTDEQYSKAKLTGMPNTILKMVDLFNNSQPVTEMWNLFDCPNLSNVYSELFINNEQLVLLENAFQNCGITTIPGDIFKPLINVTSLSGCFDGCLYLQSIPDNIFSNNLQLTSLNYTFRNCTSIEEIPDNLLNTLNINSAFLIFSGCTSLQNISDYLFPATLTRCNDGFSNCTSLVSVPQHLFNLASNSLLSNIARLFQNCTSLKSVPDNLLNWINSSSHSLSSFTSLFDGCTSLVISTGILPSNNFSGEPDETTLSRTFYRSNYSSTEVGEAPFLWEYPNVKGIMDTYAESWKTCFGGAGNSAQSLINYPIIPTQLGGPYTQNSMTITVNTGIVNSTNTVVRYPFQEGTYSSIGTLTIEWGDGKTTSITNGEITSSNTTHIYDSAGIYKIKVISSSGNIPPLGAYDSSTWDYLVTELNDTILHEVNELGMDMQGMRFNNYSNLEKVSPCIFYYNQQMTNFGDCFRSTGLKEIPKGLFKYAPNAQDLSSCFFGCTGITSIPSDLFANCPNLTDVSNCFHNCTGITSIPSDLFTNCPNLTDFNGCFYNCTGVNSIGSDVFCSEEEKQTRFANQTVDFTSCFYNCGSSNNTITLPDLWNYNYYLVSSNSCFTEFNGTPTNWAEVPSGWGGEYSFLRLNIDTTKAGGNDATFTVPFVPGQYYLVNQFEIDWGDGNISTMNYNINATNCTHIYDNPGQYSILISNSTNGRMPIFSFGYRDNSNALKLLTVEGSLYKMVNADYESEPIANFDYMFSGCVNLTKVDSGLLANNPKDDMVEGYPSAIRMFEDTNISILPNNFFDGTMIQNYQNCFYNCSSLTAAPILQNAYNYNNCFYGCSSLTTIPSDIFAWRGQSVQTTRYFNFCFSNCTSLEEIPADIFTFLDEEYNEFTGCFNNCINLKTIPDSLFEYAKSTEFSMCFENCNKLSINPNMFGNSPFTLFSSLPDNEMVEMSNMFSISSFSGNIGTTPDIWNYPYSHANYNNIFKQTNQTEDTKVGVTMTFNTDSSININGTATSQIDFSSNSFSFSINPSSWYNFCLQHISGGATINSTSLLRLEIVDNQGTSYYSKIFNNINALSKWEGFSFPSSTSTAFTVNIRIYGGNSYDNLLIMPKLSIANVNFNECFSGHSINSLTNYNNIPASWK